jgi:uncharacterized protein (DUF1697 family)
VEIFGAGDFSDKRDKKGSIMDIIELILSNYTDFIKFEDLANEIMIQEGYNNLIPVGGWHDDGVDARLVKYYQQKEYNIIFQYSMQKETKSKISLTYKKIKEKGKKCDELIIVTSEKINNKEEVKKNFRKEFGIKPRIEIYDRQTFKSRLGSNPSLLNRFFPNIRKQLESDLFKPITSGDNKYNFCEKSLTKITIAFSQDKLFFESNKRLFDSMVQYFIYLNDKCSINELNSEICKNLNAEIQESRVNASLNRLLKLGKVKKENDYFLLAKDERIRIEEISNALISEKEALFEDVLYKAQYILKKDMSPASIQIAKQNIEESITDYFKLYSLEKSLSENDYELNELEFSLSLINKLKQGLPDEEADILVYTVGEVLKKPTIEQKATLKIWCQTYVGCQVLKLDPKQITLQASQLKNKKFVLDTDFALNLIISEVSQNSTYKRIIIKLIEYDAKVFIPTDVLDEVAKHAEFAHRSYKYFQNKFDTLDPIVLEQQIKNVFTKGYFVGKANGVISNSTNFDDYVKNYYNKERPIDYLISLLSDSISEKIEFIELSDVELEHEEYSQLEELQEKIYDLTLKTYKAEFRNEEENREIARIDARLYLNYWHKNKEHKNASNRFKYDYYVLTTSTRPLKCAKELNIFTQFYIKPLKMISLLEKIEPFELSYEEFSNIFSNPFLAYSVSENWNYIEKLIDIGVNLQDANITRLKWELSEVFEKDLLADEGYEGEVSPELESTDEHDDAVKEFIEISKEITQHGYKFIPPIKKLIDKYEEEMRKNIENKEIMNELEEKIDKIGKRKRKHLKRIAKQIHK